MDYVFYECKAKYDHWFKFILTLLVFIVFISGIFVVREEPDSLIILLVTAILLTLFLWTIMPRKFRVMSDRLKVVLGGNVSFCIPYRKIKLVREMKGTSIGINFATSVKTAVEVVMNGCINVNFSPENRDEFINNINKAIANWRRYSRVT